MKDFAVTKSLLSTPLGSPFSQIQLIHCLRQLASIRFTTVTNGVSGVYSASMASMVGWHENWNLQYWKIAPIARLGISSRNQLLLFIPSATLFNTIMEIPKKTIERVR